eukprot:275380_1
MLTSHSSPIRSKRFAFTPNYAIKNEFADPNIVSTLMTLGDKLRNHKYCEEAVLSTNNHSTELALKWILKHMTQSKQTPSITPRITQSTTVSSPILVAISPKQSKQNRNKYNSSIYNHKNSHKNNIIMDDLMETIECNIDENITTTYPPPLSIGKPSYNEEDEIISPTTITITPNNNSISNISNTNNRLLSTLLADTQEIIPMSPVTPTDEISLQYTPTPPSFGILNSSISHTDFNYNYNNNNNNNNKDKIYNILYIENHNLNLVLQFLNIKDRIMCSLLCKLMNNLVFNNSNFDDIWLTFNNNNNNNNNMQLNTAKTISERYYKNCVNINVKY